MQQLKWSDSGGTAQWSAAPGLWCGQWTPEADKQGAYASSRGSMVSFVLAGTMEVELGPKRQTWCLSEGCALLIGARTPFRYRLQAGSRLCTMDLPAGFPEALGLAPIVSARLPRRLAQRLARAPHEASESWVRAVLSEARSLGGAVTPMEPVHNTARVMAVKGYLDRNYRSGITLTQVAKQFGMGLSYLSRSFTQATGLSPQQYVQHLRVEHFLRLLLTGRGALSLIANESGFGDYPSFCRLLRQRLGAAPSALLKDQTFPTPRTRAG